MKALFLLLINGYRRWISPLVGPRCKYYPTCSTYAVEAIETHGALKGLVLTLWRLARCNPWSTGGIDHVPLVGHWEAGPSRIFSDDDLRAYWRALDNGDETGAEEIAKQALRRAQSNR
ncbi:MAG: membrane protein insertion efficiency factor YidD [Actinomycetaceae bacterium]|nr:membrane protein insertion efficiency factor YidD [Actinomycetaceae bacterium]